MTDEKASKEQLIKWVQRFFTKLYAKVESVQWTEDEWAVLDLENTPEILDEFLDNTTHLLKDGDGVDDDAVFHDASLVMPPPNSVSSPALPASANVVLAGTSQSLQQSPTHSQVAQKKVKEQSGKLFSSLEDDDDEQCSQHSDSGSSSSSRRRRPAFPTNRRNRRRERRRPDSET
ncbi:MAG: hypothetical protein GY737_10275, partial [Desulfobacteraceae bacterium]|nr:hypothetical protein [Desulfobacteraceae bacterium]